MGDPLAIIWRLVLVSALLAALMALVTAYLAPDPDTVARGNREVTIGLGIAYFASYWLWVRKAQADAVPRGQQAGPIMLLLVVSLFLSLTPLFAPLLGVADQDWATRAWEAERAWVATLGVAAALVLYLRGTRGSSRAT